MPLLSYFVLSCRTTWKFQMRGTESRLLEQFMSIHSHSAVSFQCDFNEQATRVGETIKSEARRRREHWFEHFAPDNQSGIDIGCGQDPIHPTFVKWDEIYRSGDATYMNGVENNKFHTVYASHILEHLDKPIASIQNWFRICEPNGHLIICVPHRDLYEQKITLPSLWSGNHKWFYLPEASYLPDTRSLKLDVQDAIPEARFVFMRTLRENYVASAGRHPEGEYSIEIIVQKRAI